MAASDPIRAMFAELVAESSGPVLARLTAIEQTLARIEAALPPCLVSVKDAAALWGVSESTVKRLVRDKAVPVRRLGHLVRIDVSQVRGVDVVELAGRARHTRRSLRVVGGQS